MRGGRSGPRQPGGGKQTAGPRRAPAGRGGRQDRQRVPGEKRADVRGKGHPAKGASKGRPAIDKRGPVRGKPAQDGQFAGKRSGPRAEPNRTEAWATSVPLLIQAGKAAQARPVQRATRVLRPAPARLFPPRQSFRRR